MAHVFAFENGESRVGIPDRRAGGSVIGVRYGQGVGVVPSAPADGKEFVEVPGVELTSTPAVVNEEISHTVELADIARRDDGGHGDRFTGAAQCIQPMEDEAEMAVAKDTDGIVGGVVGTVKGKHEPIDTHHRIKTFRHVDSIGAYLNEEAPRLGFLGECQTVMFPGKGFSAPKNDAGDGALFQRVQYAMTLFHGHGVNGVFGCAKGAGHVARGMEKRDSNERLSVLGECFFHKIRLC